MLRGDTRESWTRTRGVGCILGHTWHSPTPVPSSRWAWETKFLARLIRVPAGAEESAAGNGCSAPHSMTRTSTGAPSPVSTDTLAGGCLAAMPAASDLCRGHPTAHRTPSRPGGVGRRLRSRKWLGIIIPFQRWTESPLPRTEPQSHGAFPPTGLTPVTG